MNKSSNYRFIFQSTFLFGFVKIFGILSKIGLTKVVSIFLGPSGVGVMGLYQSTIQLIATFSGLGLSQSAIRDISESKKSKDQIKISKILSLTNSLIMFSALLGFLITIVFSNFFSFLTFGNNSARIYLIFLSVAVFFTILNEGRLAVLKGNRDLNSVAKANILGSFFSFVLGSICYYFLGSDGIVPSLIVMPFILFLFSNFYFRRIKFKKIKLNLSNYINDAPGMLKMGLSLMYVSLTIIITEYVIKTHILTNSNIEVVGFFQAGSTIVMGYFGIITSAMATDYYPRISAINRDNIKLNDEVNKQSRVGLILLGPLVVLFLFLMPYLIELLYSKLFLMSIEYISYAIFGVILISCSNSMGMVLIAKQDSRIFLFTVSFNRLLLIFLSIYSFEYLGLKGLGISYFIFSIAELILMQIVLNYFYKIKINFKTAKILIITLLLSFLAFITLDIDKLWVRYLVSVVLFLISCTYSLNVMKNIMSIDLLKMIKNKFVK